MHTILGHKSWNEQEVIDILITHGTFTCCILRHHRYLRVKQICTKLRQAGLIVSTGKTAIAMNFRVTGLFRAWREATDRGETRLGCIKWCKEQRRNCRQPEEGTMYATAPLPQ